MRQRRPPPGRVGRPLARWKTPVAFLPPLALRRCLLCSAPTAECASALGTWAEFFLYPSLEPAIATLIYFYQAQHESSSRDPAPPCCITCLPSKQQWYHLHLFCVFWPAQHDCGLGEEGYEPLRMLFSHRRSC